MFWGGVEGIRMRFSLCVKGEMWQMMQKLLLLQTDNFLPEMRAVDVQGRTQGDS